jgi:hypothetical protein
MIGLHARQDNETPGVEMSRSAAPVQLGSEFNAFLFAPIGDEKNGMVLSVLSALARLGVDPWREATELARMPRAAANQRLTSLIAALPDAPSTRSQPGTIADRLIALLPRGDSSSLAARATLLGADAVPISRRGARVLAVNLLLLAGMLCAQWALVNLKPPADADAIPAPASSTTLSPVPPPGAGP